MLLQKRVTWDEPESLQNVNRVNPWQVEYIPATPFFDPEFPPSKRFRIMQNPETVSAGEGNFRLPQLTRPMAGHLNPAALSHAPFSAGMQGARPDHICISNASSDRTLQTSNELPKNDAAPELKTVSTVLSIGVHIPTIYHMVVRAASISAALIYLASRDRVHRPKLGRIRSSCLVRSFRCPSLVEVVQNLRRLVQMVERRVALIHQPSQLHSGGLADKL
ncbi:UNVERIFIED_CONTAM: Auxin response factor 17 [Sesamum latifolium]|uniref:Auxin response factor 17 n=1 Tax=Sesamum latifolium TaxID=2727402 RepID=A0AAW2VSJ1_9LAMI